MNLEPLYLSLRVATSAALLSMLIGVPLAAYLARRTTFLARILDAFATLPLVLPPTVLGYYLLVAFGARSPLGAALDAIGLPLVFTWRGAVLAAAFVSLPLITQSALAALETVDPDLEDVARTLGHSKMSVFLSISLPLAWRGIMAGLVLAFARALGEFGATLLVAGNIPGRTQTMPMAIYDAVQSGNQVEANMLALLLTAAAFLLLILIRRFGQGVQRG
jgi:molybdate transport system permease protein